MNPDTTGWLESGNCPTFGASDPKSGAGDPKSGGGATSCHQTCPLCGAPARVVSAREPYWKCAGVTSRYEPIPDPRMAELWRAAEALMKWLAGTYPQQLRLRIAVEALRDEMEARHDG